MVLTLTTTALLVSGHYDGVSQVLLTYNHFDSQGQEVRVPVLTLTDCGYTKVYCPSGGMVTTTTYALLRH